MVNRCVCHEVPFWAIAALAKQGESFEQIREATHCCQGCGTCEPYVRKVIATGATSLPLLTPEEQDEIMAEARRRAEAERAAGPPGVPDQAE
ncbi:MAG: hypothetical protein Q8L55_15655 [Phycisphaerales bacterium]|nr:hypothetical protein [Phycisphaerales bacterium]